MLCIDLSTQAPARRQAVLLEACDALLPGAALEIVADHDPAPLYFRIDRAYPGDYGWHYLQSGPDRWQVRISRVQARAPASVPANCGGSGGCGCGGD